MKWVNNIIEIAAVRAKSQREDIGAAHTFMKLESSYLDIDSHQGSVSITVKPKAIDKEKKR